MKNKDFFSLFLRYLIVLFSAIPNFYIFYAIFTHLTIYISYGVFSLFFETTILNDIILIGNINSAQFPIQIISACVAGSAYFFLFALNMLTPIKKISTRIISLIFSFSLLLLVNVLRIFFMGILFINSFTLFDIFHKIFWYFLSIIFVICIWFLEVKLFKIKNMPVYSDLKLLYSKSTFKK